MPLFEPRKTIMLNAYRCPSIETCEVHGRVTTTEKKCEQDKSNEKRSASGNEGPAAKVAKLDSSEHAEPMEPAEPAEPFAKNKAVDSLAATTAKNEAN